MVPDFEVVKGIVEGKASIAWIGGTKGVEGGAEVGDGVGGFTFNKKPAIDIKLAQTWLPGQGREGQEGREG